jgi:hypothetical protein
MRALRTAAVGALAAVLTALPAAAQAVTIGEWGMNEPQGSTLMVDSSGNGLDGTIGSDVVLAEATPDGGYAYRFKGDWRIVNDNRLVTWPDDDRLDPGTGTFAVTIRLKTGALDPNIIQKGQANQAGGYWKFVLKKGWPRCHFRDQFDRTKAIGFVNDPRPETKVADNQWHTLRCERTPTGVRATINYGEPNAITKFIRGTIGNVNNSRPMFLGGKLDCDGSTVTCDYFAGAVDWVTIEKP